jgi:WD40 repeat protein
MEWSEFVMFVIEQVTMDTSYEVHERLEALGIQSFPAIVSNPVSCSKVFENIKRSLVCVNDQIFIYHVDKSYPTYMSLSGAIKLDEVIPLQNTTKVIPSFGISSKANSLESKQDPTSKHGLPSRPLHLSAHDIAHLPSKDFLFILRNDFSVEILKFSSRAKFTPETIMFIGMHKLPASYIKLALRDIPAAVSYTGTVKSTLYQGPYAMFALGSTNQIDYWEMDIKKNGEVVFKSQQYLCDHKDYVRDMLIIHTEAHKYFVTCSLDKTVILYDLQSLKIKGVRTGHVMGVQCLAFDNRSTLLAGGYDYSIIGWDLEAAINRPLFHLVGHENVVAKMVALGDVSKCFSMDQSGIIKYWDTSKSCPYDKEARNIDTIESKEDRIRGFDVMQV